MPQLPRDLSSATLVYVAPRASSSGVGDYADDLLEFAQGRFAKIVEVRHGGAGEASIRDVLRSRAAIKKAVREADGPVIVHSEQSGGSLVPFWGTMGIKADVRSATVHDAPLSIWLPFRTKLVSRNRFVQHGLHFPFLPLLHRLERNTMRGSLLFLLTESGAEATKIMMSKSEIVETFHPIPDRPLIELAEDRPLAIGLYGYVYKGKGFDRLEELRRLVDDRIEIRVAGRGTEALPPMAGVTILGGVDGLEEDAFFASIRAMIVPYSRRSSYGPETHVASGTVARAIAYQTPVVAIRFPGVDEEMMIVEEFAHLAARIEDFVEDRPALVSVRTKLAELGAVRTTRNAFERYAATWQEAL